MRMKRTVLLAIFTMALTTLWAQGPNGSGTYYQKANGLKGKALKSKLAGIIVNPRNVGYDGLWNAYKKTDTRADGYVRDWYSNITNYRHITDKAGSYQNEGDCYNREHTVPQDWFSGSGIKSDIVHVVPTDGKINGYRSNHPFGEVGSNFSGSANNYSKWGNARAGLGYSGTVFEPNDEIKGDIARIYFYMITRYEGTCESWGNSVFTSTYPGLTKWTLDMMMRWSKEDPVDDVETARNNAVFDVQGNRNPYVDYPGLEEYTWGSMMDVPFSYDNYGGDVTMQVSQPTFSPAGGRYEGSVTVTLSCSTDDVVIYYTTDGSEATQRSNVYAEPFELTETTTVKAIAVKEDAVSTQATATYTIVEEGSGEQTPVGGTYALNNSFFGTSFDGSIASNHSETLTGTHDGITITYDLAEGVNRYCNNEQIRLYPGNRLTISANDGSITAIEFTSPEAKSGLQASTGTMTGDLTWTGDASSIVFTYNSTKHIKLSAVKVTLSGTTGIKSLSPALSQGEGACFTLSGRRVSQPTKGLYIINGKKVIIK